MDTQGYELPIFKGEESTLKWISAIQLEVFLTPICKDQPLIEEVVPFLRKRGFLIYGMPSVPKGTRVQKQHRSIEADFLFIKA